jgi:hypothetical protein
MNMEVMGGQAPGLPKEVESFRWQPPSSARREGQDDPDLTRGPW